MSIGFLHGAEPADGTRLADSPLLEDLAPDLARRLPAPERSWGAKRSSWLRRAGSSLLPAARRHRGALLWMAPLLVLAGFLHGWNMHHAPGPMDDEGTYVSEAWALLTYGQLSHYTYWYDHPPLGWMLLSVWDTVLLDEPRRADLWYSGRDAMLLVHLVSCLLLFILARRLELPRWAASLAVLLFTVSPLGMAWQRLTLLDNIGTPLLIGAWVLVLSPRRRLLAYAGSALLFACAVLVKETNALFLPAIAAQLWFASRDGNRRFAIALYAGIFSGITLLYPLYAVLKNELIPGPGHVSLLWALRWQLFDRPGSGSAFDPTSGTHRAIADWLSRDRLLLISALVTVPLVVWRRRTAIPLAGLVVLLVAMPLRGGYVPAPYPINLVWPCALLAAVGAHTALTPLLHARWHAVRRATALIAATAVIGVGAAALRADRPYLTANDDREYAQALRWLQANTHHDDVMLVDNTLWIDLVERGYPRRDIIWFYKFDLDPAVQHAHPGWRSVDYVVESSIIGATDSSLPMTRSAIAHGRVVAAYGDIHIYQLPRATTHA